MHTKLEGERIDAHRGRFDLFLSLCGYVQLIYSGARCSLQVYAVHIIANVRTVGSRPVEYDFKTTLHVYLPRHDIFFRVRNTAATPTVPRHGIIAQ